MLRVEGLTVYCNGDFLIETEFGLKFFHRSNKCREIWAGSGVRTDRKMVIPLYVIDDFGDLVQVDVK